MIHERYFEHDFPFPDFMYKFLCAFTVTDEKDKIIAIAGIKPIAESIVLTDKGYSPRDRRYALYQILQASEYISKKHGFTQLHAFIQDDKFYTQMKRAGFDDINGRGVVRNL